MRKLKFHYVSCILILASFGGCSRQKKDLLPRENFDAQAYSEFKNTFNVEPTNNHTSYIYSPGLFGSELIMARYCPSFTAITGEKISWRSGGHIIGQPHSSVVFPEINLNKTTKFSFNPITAFTNGIRDDLFPLVKRLVDDMYGLHVDEKPKSDKTVFNHTINFSKINIGQKNDIKALHKTYLKHIKKYPDSEIVLFGDSRGAATTFNFIAKHRPTKVKAAIIEGIFDDIPHLIKHFVYLDKEQRTENRLFQLVQLIAGNYHRKGPFPRDYAEMISDDIPLLFVTSLKDGLCAPQGAFYLYNRLRKRGHQKVHILILENSLHPAYMLGKDKELYENIVHAFYRHYQLPHNAAKAKAGEAAFMNSKPMVVKAESFGLPTCPTCNDVSCDW